MQTSASELHDLFVAHHQGLLRLAGLLLDDRGAAEEVVQESYIRLAGALPRLRDADAVLPYLRRTVVNLAKDRLRRRRTADRHLPDPAHPADDAAVDVLRQADRDAVLAALRTLPVRQQQCLVLRYYSGLSDREVADAAGVALGSAKTHLRRGLAALARRLEDQR